MDFKTLLSANQRACLDATAAEITRLYYLPDPWLGRTVLAMARQIRAGEPDSGTYEGSLLWHLIPEHARRLGETHFLPGENTRGDLQTASARELRYRAGQSLDWTRFDQTHGSIPTDSPTFKAGDLIGHSIPNGNPVAFAADRLCSPKPGDRDDRIAQQIAEVSRAHDLPEQWVWTPSMQDYPRVALRRSTG